MDQGPTLPGVGTEDEPTPIVLHVDLDCFYAACERLREPALVGEPVVVGMGYEPGQPEGAVATASYEAREHGVESAQAISTALERLPRAAESDAGEIDDAGDATVGYYRPVDMEYYQSVAGAVKEVLHDSAATVREVSIDEAYLDVTDRTDWSVADGYARHVKQRIEREVGLTASVGVAPTMHAAKVAADHDKPDGLVVVEPGEVADFLAPLPVDDLHGVGPVTAGDLRGAGIETVADLAEADRDWLVERWGERGGELHDRARGLDPRSVEPRGRPKSLSRESAFAEPRGDHDAVRDRIRALAGAVADRARSKEALYRTIGIKVVLPPYDVNTRERSLPGPVDDPDLVETVALDLLAEFADETPRKVGVRVSNLSFAETDQSTLGGWDGPTGDRETPATGESTATDGEGPDGAVGDRDGGGDPGGAAAETTDPADGSAGTAPDPGPPPVEPDRPAESDDGGTTDADTGGTTDADTGGTTDADTGETTDADTGETTDADTGETTDADVAPTVRGGDTPGPDERPGQSVLDRVWSDGPAEDPRPEPVGQPPEQTTLSEFL